MNLTMNMPLLEIENLQFRFGSPRRTVRAVDGVSFAIQSDERVGCAAAATKASMNG